MSTQIDKIGDQIISQKITYKDKVYTYTWSPGIINERQYKQSSAFIFNGDNILLVKGKDRVYSLPGGTKEDGESSMQTCIREVFEEANVEIITALPVGEIIVSSESEVTFTQARYVSADFKAHEFTASFETSDIAWVNINKLHEYLLYAHDPVFGRPLLDAQLLIK